ncbi:DNA-directed RNA polymerase III subunit RPC9 [Tetranychus urticae]|uniref:DNA-directed RNA polymerase III subunit RPC9 n=1 Tax=Tetranychus urticae TaxID=32264 RepID=UPI00077BADDA|nr:DNA-directed RNA polymerase III subunit RPC9 [Tetranychus urticae]
MEIIKKPTILCSNYEVWNILKNVKDSKRLKDQKNLATVTYEAIKYLEETNCVYQSEETIRAFLLALKAKGIRLTKAEKLQLINNRPATLVELQLLIEENEERFSEEALNLILNLVQEYLPGDPKQEAAEMPSDEEEGSEEVKVKLEEEETGEVPMDSS